MAGKKVNIASWLNEKGDMKYYSHKLSLIEEKPKSTNVDISSDPF
jgi:hypothetical protein